MLRRVWPLLSGIVANIAKGATVLDASRAKDDAAGSGGGGAEAAPEATGVTTPEIISLTSKLCNTNEKIVSFVIQAFREGATIPFLARYRRERTNDMDELGLKTIQETHAELLAVQARRATMIKSLEERKLLTAEIAANLASATTLNALEDIYEPFKVQRVTLASRAREIGLDPIAKQLLNTVDPVDIDGAVAEAAAKKPGEDVARLLLALVAEHFTINKAAREALFNVMWTRGELSANLDVDRRKRSAQETTEETWEELMAQYKSFDGKVFHPCGMRAAQVLAYFRGEKKGALRLSLTLDNAIRVYGGVLRPKFAGFGRTRGTAEHRLLESALEYSLKESVSKAVVQQVRRQLRENAEKEAIAVFAHNLRRLLLQRPLRGPLLSMDPGFRNGIKCVILDGNGGVQRTFVVYLHQPDRMEQAVRATIDRYGVRNIAIGDGTASRETQQAVADIIKKHDPQGALGVQFASVSEAGASVYSASPIAKEEFPNIDIMYRGAISIGRRLQDPLSELIKIPVQSIGVGLYQHDVPQKQLMHELSHVAQSIVSIVGINCSTASPYVMQCIPGMKAHVARSIVAMRSNNQLRCREDLRAVPGLDATMFEQVAGFLRFPNSPNWLDNTSIHPESYGIVNALLAKLGLTITKETPKVYDVIRRAVTDYPGGLDGLVADTGSDERGRMVMEELQKPQLDPRSALKYAGVFRSAVVSAASLKVGDTVSGIVRNVTPFGVFVDIGVEDSALLARTKEQASLLAAAAPPSPAAKSADGTADVTPAAVPARGSRFDFFSLVNVGDVLENMKVEKTEKVMRNGDSRWQILVSIDQTARVVNEDVEVQQLAPRAPLEGSEKLAAPVGPSFVRRVSSQQHRDGSSAAAGDDGGEPGAPARKATPRQPAKSKSVSQPVPSAPQTHRSPKPAATQVSDADDDGDLPLAAFVKPASRAAPPQAAPAVTQKSPSARFAFADADGGPDRAVLEEAFKAFDAESAPPASKPSPQAAAPKKPAATPAAKKSAVVPPAKSAPAAIKKQAAAAAAATTKAAGKSTGKTVGKSVAAAKPSAKAPSKSAAKKSGAPRTAATFVEI